MIRRAPLFYLLEVSPRAMATTPSYDCTEDIVPDWVDEGTWGRPNLSDHPEAEAGDDFDDLSGEEQDAVRGRFIEQEGDTYGDLGNPVINPATGCLNRNGTLSARQRPASEAAEEIADELWEKEFAKDEDRAFADLLASAEEQGLDAQQFLARIANRAAEDVDVTPPEPVQMQVSDAMGGAGPNDLCPADFVSSADGDPLPVRLEEEARAWAEQKANEIAREMDEDEPYPERHYSDMQRADASELESGTLVTWGPSNAPRYGEVQEVHTDGEVTSNSGAESETTMEASDENPVVEIAHFGWVEDPGAWEQTDTTTAHRPDNLEIIDTFPERSVREPSARQYEGRSYQSRVSSPEIRETSDGKVTVKVMTDDIARDGLVIDPAGLETEGYMKYGSVLWQHGNDPRRGAEPIANCVNLIPKEDGYLAEVRFTQDEDDTFAKRIEKKVRNKEIRAVSLGWQTKEVEREERGGETVPVVKRAEMTEFSFVGVPADTGALVTSREHYPAEAPAETSEFHRVCEGLICLEAVRRTMDGMTHKQALEAVKAEIEAEVAGGMDELKSPGCPFIDMINPAAQFEALAGVLQASADALMQAAAVDGCSYERNADVETRGQRGAMLGNFLKAKIEMLAQEGDDTSADLRGEMAQQAGISKSTVDSIIAGEIMCPPLERLEAFASVLQVDTSDLVAMARADDCDYERSNENDDTRQADADCGCTGTEGTPSTPSSRPGTPGRDERDASPSREELLKKLQIDRALEEKKRGLDEDLIEEYFKRKRGKR